MMRHATPRLSGSVLGLALAALAAAALPTSADGPVRLLGKVRSVADDHASFKLRARGGTYEVQPQAGAAFTVFKTQTLGELTGAVQGRILAKASEATTESEAFLGNVYTIVLGSGFEPPPLPDRIKRMKLQWISATISPSVKGGPIQANHYQLLVPSDRPVAVHGTGGMDAITEKAIVLLDGERTGDKRSKTVLATAITVLAPELPMREYEVILGLR